MSLLGIDVGTTGCKSALFSETGALLALEYREYDHRSPHPGWAELDSNEVWHKVKETIAGVGPFSGKDAIKALAVTSLGEAMVPVTRERDILGPSLLNYGVRGQQYSEMLREKLPDPVLYPIAGVNFASHFSMTKLMWLREYMPELYQKADYFLPWTSFVSFMLGAEPVVDFSVAARTMLFDIVNETWSDQLLEASGVERQILPATAPAGTLIGQVSNPIAAELHLPENLPIVIGPHDQCANALGCGAVHPGQAMLGMGTFTCAVPVFKKRHHAEQAIPLGINTQHHAVPGRYVSFIYNQGGAVVKWFRDTYASFERQIFEERGEDLYEHLFREIPLNPSTLFVLPYFSTTGLPDFSPQTSGVITGLRLSTRRGEILKGIIEGIMLDLRVSFQALNAIGLGVDTFIAVGGGSKSDGWMSVCADILGCTVQRARGTESGGLGAAITAGVGVGCFGDYYEGAQAMVSLGEKFNPDHKTHQVYEERLDHFKTLRTGLSTHLAERYRENMAIQNLQD